MEKYYIPGTKGSVFSLRGEFSFGVDSILLSAFSKTKSVNLAVDLCRGGPARADGGGDQGARGRE